MKRSILGILMVMAAAIPAWAQEPPDPLGDYLFPPDLVMQHQQAIGLKEEQGKAIQAEVQKAQGKFTDIQWQLTREMESLYALVKQSQVNEEQVLAQLDKILGFEREIKRTQVALMVRIKNILTPEQQKQLHDLKPHQKA